MSLIYCIHITSGKAKLSGNIKSLCTPGVKPLFRQFYSFFNDCPNVNDDRIKRLIIRHKYKYPSIVDASELILPFTDLSESIYARMFWNCKKLKYPPKVLPAKTVPENAYSYMFSGCDRLKYIPKILGNTFETNSCSEMFYGCLSIKNISESFPSNFEYTGVNAFLKCFANCIGLEKISNTLFSKELYRHCFKSIFANTKVKTIPKLNLHISRTNKQHQHYFWCAGCYKDMFDNIPDEYFKHMSVFQKNLFIEA